MSDPVRQDPRAIIAWTVGLVVLTALALWAMYVARDVILLIYISIVLAIGFGPIVRAVERRPLLVGKRRVPRWLAILVIYLAMLGVLVFVVATGLPPLISQARALGAGLPGMVESAQAYLVAHGLLEHQLTWQELVQRVPAGVAGVGGDAVTTVLLTVMSVAGGAFGVVTILILTFYLLVEADEIFDTMKRLVPPAHRARFQSASNNISLKVSAWLGGQLLLGVVIGTSATIGLWLIGVPYFFVLGVVAGIGELIPMVGPLLSAIPAVAVALSVSTGHAVATAIFFIVQQQLENHVLVPKIMSKQVGVSAVTVLVALLIGASLLGIIGALLAVPTAAMIQVVFDELTQRRLTMAASTPEPENRVTARVEWPRAWRGAAWAALLYSALAVAWTWPLITAISRSVPSDMGDPVLNTWILRWTSEHITSLAAGHVVGLARVVEPGDFPSGATCARVLRTSRRAGAAGAAAARRHRQRDPRLQRLAPADVRAVGAWGIPAGARSHGQRARGTSRRTVLRLRAVSHRPALSPAGALGAVDAARDLCGPSAHRHGIARIACRVRREHRLCRICSCGYFLRLFSPFLALWTAGEITARNRWRDRALLLRPRLRPVPSCWSLTAPFLVPILPPSSVGLQSQATSLKSVSTRRTSRPTGRRPRGSGSGERRSARRARRRTSCSRDSCRSRWQ